MAQTDFQPTWALIRRPSGYPTGPSVGKPEMILNTNSGELYHRFSPYSNYSQNGGLLNWGDQPFHYVYIDQANDFPNNRAFQSQVFPLQDSLIDIQRITKFLVSGNGVTFLAKQLLLQTGNAFDETRIYNPTSPIVASGMGITFNAVRPERFIDTSGGIDGVAQSLLGGAGALLAGGSSINPPSSTTGKGALPTANASTDGKGLLRGGDANKGLANFNLKWAPAQGSTNSFMSMVSSIASSLFNNFIPARQNKNIQFRSDEGSYGIMLSAASPRFDYTGNNGTTFGFGQIWTAGNAGANGIRKQGEYTPQPTRIFVNADKNGKITTVQRDTTEGLSGYISSLGSIEGEVGYKINPSTNPLKPGYRYGDATNPNSPLNAGSYFKGSDIMFQYQYFDDVAQAFPTKDPEAQITDDAEKLSGQYGNFQKIITAIQNASNKVYSGTTPDGVILGNSSTRLNYDNLTKVKNKYDAPTTFGFLKAYRDSGVRMVSDDISIPQNSYGLPSSFNADNINTLNVLDASQKGDAQGNVWSPYKDDLIALYFYDVVNNKYIPFRSAIKGVSENANASWEEMPFIGRADKVYSYGGFTRNLTFTLHVVISSIKELAPTWQRINYMMTSYKPSNYTKMALANGTAAYNRFMVPPMFMLTMGDLYRDQPILIQSIVMNIPEDAAWETYNQDNTSQNQWKYMANTIKAATGTMFGQVPREVELSVTAILLEKERAVVGGANFGHAPRTDDFNSWNYDAAGDATVNKWNENYVVKVPNLTSPDTTK